MALALAASHWNPPDRNVLEFYERVAPLALQPNRPIRFLVGYVDDKPVATSGLTVGGDTAGIYNVATLVAYRRRGYGSTMK